MRRAFPRKRASASERREPCTFRTVRSGGCAKTLPRKRDSAVERRGIIAGASADPSHLRANLDNNVLSIRDGRGSPGSVDGQDVDGGYARIRATELQYSQKTALPSLQWRVRGHEQELATFAPPYRLIYLYRFRKRPALKGIRPM